MSKAVMRRKQALNGSDKDENTRSVEHTESKTE